MRQTTFYLPIFGFFNRCFGISFPLGFNLTVKKQLSTITFSQPTTIQVLYRLYQNGNL